MAKAKKHGCKFCTTPCERFGSGEACPAQSEVLGEVDDAKSEVFEVHEEDFDLKTFDFGEEDTLEPPVDSSNLDLIPDCNVDDEPDSDGLEDEATQAYLNGEDSDEDSAEETYVKSGRAVSKGQVKYKHDRHAKQALEAKAAKFEKAKFSKNVGDAHTAEVKAGQAHKDLKKLETREEKKTSAHHKAKKT